MLLPFVTVSFLSAAIVIGAPQATSLSLNNQQQGSASLNPTNDGFSSSNSTSNSNSNRQSNSPQSETSRNSSSLSTAIYEHLKICHDGIQTHSTTIAKHCGGANNENAQDSGSNILLEIQAILILVMTCAVNIQASVTWHAASSGATIAKLFGGGGGSSGSTSGSESFTFSDCANMFYTLIKLLQGCYTQVAGVSYKFPAIRVLCADSLAQLSTCLSQIVHSCGLAMPGFVKEVNELCSDQFELFMQTGFGFAQFMKMMKR
ncbi:secreted protein [Melampsora americana]|nr:secreted protein [Melampsora americana]